MNNSYQLSKISRKEKEDRLRQQAKSIWMTGLPGSGKTTLGLGLEHDLFLRGYFCQLLDGDDVRSGLNKDLRYSEADRLENIRRIAEVNSLFNHSGIITINCFISPTHSIRQMARNIIGDENFIEVFIDAPLSLCEKRDPKGMYKKARQGLIKDFTGVDAPFEEPENPALVVNTAILSIDQALKKMIEFIIPSIAHPNPNVPAK